MIAKPLFGMRGEPSFRNDGVHFDMTSPAPSFRKQGGFPLAITERFSFTLSFSMEWKGLDKEK